MGTLTASLEDYLEVIFNHVSSGCSIRAIDISKELNVSRASVTEALKKLDSKEFITYGRYGNITLTDKGSNLAQQVVYKHNVLQTFFIKIGLDKKEASENACKIEHIITDNAFKKIEEYIVKKL